MQQFFSPNDFKNRTLQNVSRTFAGQYLPPSRLEPLNFTKFVSQTIRTSRTFPLLPAESKLPNRIFAGHSCRIHLPKNSFAKRTFAGQRHSKTAPISNFCRTYRPQILFDERFLQNSCPPNHSYKSNLSTAKIHNSTTNH
jgi:hypothetical protein